MSVDGLRFRSVMSRFATGVTVVTTFTDERRPVGFTATAFSSVSLTPPLALVCAARGKPSHAALSESEGFAVNILSSDQQELALRFADPAVVDRFAGLDVRVGELGLPMIAGTVAGIECRRRSVLAGGDHSIFVGEVKNLWHTDAMPLLHFARRFAELQLEPQAVAAERADWLVGAPW
jgi:flavin reductase (DIM6/NTAB) family NADH-FMN oxidoreductase RutF